MPVSIHNFGAFGKDLEKYQDYNQLIPEEGDALSDLDYSHKGVSPNHPYYLEEWWPTFRDEAIEATREAVAALQRSRNSGSDAHGTFQTEGISWTLADVLNPYDYIPPGDYNPCGMKAFAVGAGDVTDSASIVFASSLEDALDEAADHGRLEAARLHHHPTTEEEEEMGYIRLGNEGDLYEDAYVWGVEINFPEGLLPLDEED